MAASCGVAFSRGRVVGSPGDITGLIMAVVPIRAKTVLIRRKHLDSWFLSRAGMNLYRGCSHDCAYCDGRSETYRLEGDFSGNIVYKENAPDVLGNELDPRRRRKSFRSGYLFLGGGVSDSWQSAEREIELTRAVLKLFRVFPHPLLLLTKSSLILRDFDLLKELKGDNQVTVAVSISSMNRKISNIVEPGASPPEERLEVVREARKAGLGAGVMLMPVIPLITDRPEMLEETFRSCRDAGAEFVIPGSMTLKAGRQRDYFLTSVIKHFPDELSRYSRIYGPASDRWGSPSADYFSYFGKLVDEISRPFRLNRRIPGHLFPGNITPFERAAVMLDQMHGVLRDRGIFSPYGNASRALWADIDEAGYLERGHPISGAGNISGIGGPEVQIIREILDTGTSPVYENVLVGGNPRG